MDILGWLSVLNQPEGELTQTIDLSNPHIVRNTRTNSKTYTPWNCHGCVMLHVWPLSRMTMKSKDQTAGGFPLPRPPQNLQAKTQNMYIYIFIVTFPQVPPSLFLVEVRAVVSTVLPNTKQVRLRFQSGPPRTGLFPLANEPTTGAASAPRIAPTPRIILLGTLRCAVSALGTRR